jgi:hypothetical protein
MLNFGECFLILSKENNDYKILNTIYPHNMVYEDKKLLGLLIQVRRNVTQWYDNYFKNKNDQLCVGIGEKDLSDGQYKILRLI